MEINEAIRSPLDDPHIDQVWEEAVRAWGWKLVRTRDAYASADGQGHILIGERDTLDDDDNVAQLVFHELCHALVEGEARWDQPDFGLDNMSERDLVREHACLRLQAHLADAYGLRALMTPTTISRAYYVALPGLPLSEDGDPATLLARAAAELASRAPYKQALARALTATSARVRDKRQWAVPSNVHPLGFAIGRADQNCGTCGWRYGSGRGGAIARCRQSAPEGETGRRIEDDFPACERWEPEILCETCGACCREAYHVVSVSVRDAITWKHPDRVARDGHRFHMIRNAERCGCLDVRQTEQGKRYSCVVYEDRPRTCREFARASDHCLVARRRVGLSR